MKTPTKVSPRELALAITVWLANNAILAGDEYHCTACGTLVLLHDVAFSLHAAEFGDDCAGSGRVERVHVPYCPHCEPIPQGYACIHIPSLGVCGQRESDQRPTANDQRPRTE
jgi:hypothetical protein